MPTRLKEDIATIIKNDPATKSFFDAFLTNPGLHALWWHRVANFFIVTKWFCLEKYYRRTLVSGLI